MLLEGAYPNTQKDQGHVDIPLGLLADVRQHPPAPTWQTARLYSCERAPSPKTSDAGAAGDATPQRV